MMFLSFAAAVASALALTVTAAAAGSSPAAPTVAADPGAGHDGGMIRLVRAGDALQLSPLLWDAFQVFAAQSGWRPTGAGSAGRDGRRSYGRGQRVRKDDALGLAAALERFVNSERADGGEIDLASLVGLVNFLRGGGFEIR
jgi:hypothetical protein